MSQGRTASSSEGARPTSGRPAPNYAARRMLVSTISVALVVAAGVLIWRLTQDGSATAEPESGTWDEVVFVNRVDGAVTTVNREGKPAETLPSTSRTIDAHVQGSHLALVEAAQIVLSDLGGGAPDVIPIEPESVVSRVPVADSLWLVVSKASGGNLLLVDGLTGATYDFAALAQPIQTRFFVETLRYDPGGTIFAAADTVNFQTVIVDTKADPPAASFFQDLPLAVDREHVVTSQVVGQQADLTLFDVDGSQQATVKDALPAGGALDGDEAVVASIEGAISRFGPGDDTSEKVGAVAVPAETTIRWVRPTADGTRFVVFGDVFEAVVDLDGNTVFTTTFTTAVEQPRIEPAWSCLPVGGGDTYHSIVDLESGEQIADLTGVAVTGISADGCTVVGTRAGASEVIGDGGSVPLGRVRNATLAPDGRAVVVQDTTGKTQLIPIEDEWTLGQAVDLTASAPANAIVNFRER